MNFSKWQTSVFGIDINGILSCFYSLNLQNKCTFLLKKIWNIFIYFNLNGTVEFSLGRGRKKINLTKKVFVNQIVRDIALWRYSHGVKGFFGWNTGGRESKQTSFQHALEHPLINTFLVSDLRFLSSKAGCVPLFSETAKHKWNFKNMLMWCLYSNAFLRLGTDFMLQKVYFKNHSQNNYP